MPETYTQEQIHNIATAIYGWTAIPRILPSAPGTGPDWDISADIRAILFTLSTAEQERDALKAQVAELEAKLQGAADRAMKIQFFYKNTNENILKEKSDGWLFVSCDKVFANNFMTCESQEAVVGFEDFCDERDDIGWMIVGKKED